MPEPGAPKVTASRSYRAMVLQYRIQEVLHLGAPGKQLERVALRPGEIVVDWGCGPGRVTIPVAKAVKGLLKNDASPPECDWYARETDAGSGNSSAIGATENTLSRSQVHSSGQGVAIQQPPKGGKVLAVDVERLALQVVREKAARESLDNVYTILVESHPVAIPTGSVDLVLLLDTFHAVRDKEGLLSDIGRVLKPDGHLFMDPGHMSPEKALEQVGASGLFSLEDAWGREMLFAKAL